MRLDRASEIVVELVEQAADAGIPMFALYASDNDQWHFAGRRVNTAVLITALREVIKELETTPLSEDRTLN